MPETMSGKTAVILGAASGIGAAAARHFAALGCKLILADIQTEAGKLIAQELGATFLQCDITQEQDVEAVAQRAIDDYGRLDIFINCAARLGVIGSITATSAEAWRKTMAILVDGPFFAIKHAARHMVPQGHGVIISIASTAGIMGGLGPHGYTTGKHALIGLIKSAASELSASRVRVLGIAPSGVLTPMAAAIAKGDVKEGLTRTSPLGSGIDPEEIAATLAFLCSTNARHMTGQTIIIDSGVTSSGLAVPMFHSAEPTSL